MAGTRDRRIKDSVPDRAENLGVNDAAINAANADASTIKGNESAKNSLATTAEIGLTNTSLTAIIISTSRTTATDVGSATIVGSAAKAATRTAAETEVGEKDVPTKTAVEINIAIVPEETEENETEAKTITIIAAVQAGDRRASATAIDGIIIDTEIAVLG